MVDISIPIPYLGSVNVNVDIAPLLPSIPGPLGMDEYRARARRIIREGVDRTIELATDTLYQAVLVELRELRDDIDAQLRLIASLPNGLRERIAYEVFSAAFEHYLPKKFIRHYIWGNARPLHLSLQEMIDCNPIIKLPYTQSFIDLKEQANRRPGIAFPLALNIRSGALTNGTLGQFTTKINGTLVASEGGAWQASGTMHFYDEWDFDPKDFETGGRSFQGEVKTRIANALLPGQGFTINSEVTEFSQTQDDETVVWAGGVPTGVPDRIAELDFTLSQPDR